LALVASPRNHLYRGVRVRWPFTPSLNPCDAREPPHGSPMKQQYQTRTAKRLSHLRSRASAIRRLQQRAIEALSGTPPDAASASESLAVCRSSCDDFTRPLAIGVDLYRRRRLSKIERLLEAQFFVRGVVFVSHGEPSLPRSHMPNTRHSAWFEASRYYFQFRSGNCRPEVPAWGGSSKPSRPAI
jgi:hypothetical protein